MFKRLLLVSFVVLLYLIAFMPPTLVQSSQARPKKSFDDDSIIRSLKKNGIKYTTKRAVLWIEKGYLADDEIEKFSSLIDRGIIRVEKYLGVPFDKERYKDDKIHYFIKSGRFASHVYAGYNQRKFRKPIVFLSFVKEKRAPHLHETVHIVTWDFRSLWIREGLAIYLNNKLGGYPAFPNFGRDIDDCAKEYLNRNFKYVFRLIGKNGIPQFSRALERRVFYYFCGSFVKFFEGEIGIEKFMQIYNAKNTKKAIVEVTGKKVEEWKKAWLDTLNVQL